MSGNIITDFIEWLFGSRKPESRKRKNRIKQKVFISFAIEDKVYRDFLVSQVKNKNSPFYFTDMSVREAWNNNLWKRECRKRIRECDAMIALLSKNTWHSGGARWEIKCARQERIRLLGMYVQKDNKGAIPPELEGKRVIEWSWNNLERFLN